MGRAYMRRLGSAVARKVTRRCAGQAEGLWHVEPAEEREPGWTRVWLQAGIVCRFVWGRVGRGGGEEERECERKGGRGSGGSEGTRERGAMERGRE
jgi:hypothetical protein